MVFFPALSTIYLGGQKNGNGYTWANGNQAYFMVDDVTDSSIGLKFPPPIKLAATE
jgi:hypothetical protein